MTIHYKFERADKYLIIRAIGMGKSLDEYKEYAAVAADFCDSEDCGRLLMDDTKLRVMVGEITAEALAQWLTKKDMTGRWTKIAKVSGDESGQVSASFAELAQQNGMNFQLFDDFPPAIAWLEED